MPDKISPMRQLRNIRRRRAFTPTLINQNANNTADGNLVIDIRRSLIEPTKDSQQENNLAQCIQKPYDDMYLVCTPNPDLIATVTTARGMGAHYSYTYCKYERQNIIIRRKKGGYTSTRTEIPKTSEKTLLLLEEN